MSKLRTNIEKLIFDAQESKTLALAPELAAVIMGWLEAELADLRRTHVKLEGIDVEYLRKSVDSREATFGPDVFVELARQVLASLDGEDTDG